MDEKTFQIGLSVWIDQPVTTLTELAIEAETSGFGDLWFPDHYFLRDVYVTMATIAQRTNHVNLGTAVAAIQLRHPALIASSAMTIDEISNGRAIIGVGPGGYEFNSQFKLEVNSPLTMLKEAITIIRGLLSEGSNFQGDYFNAKGSKLTYPVRQLPIYISARGPKMTELAGEIADGVLIHGKNQTYINYVKELISLGEKRTGTPAGSCSICPIIDVEINDDERYAIELMKPRLRIMAGGNWSSSLIPIYGLDAQSVAQLKSAVSAGVNDVSNLVTENMVNVFGIAGSGKKLQKELIRLRESGLRRVILKLSGTLSQEIELIHKLKPIIEEVCS